MGLLLYGRCAFLSEKRGPWYAGNESDQRLEWRWIAVQAMYTPRPKKATPSLLSKDGTRIRKRVQGRGSRCFELSFARATDADGQRRNACLYTHLGSQKVCQEASRELDRIFLSPGKWVFSLGIWIVLSGKMCAFLRCPLRRPTWKSPPWMSRP